MKTYTYNKIISHLRNIFTNTQLLYEVQSIFITKFHFFFVYLFVYLRTCFHAYHDFWKLKNHVFR